MLQLLPVALASNPFVLPTQPVDEHLLPSLERPALTAFQDDDSVRAVDITRRYVSAGTDLPEGHARLRVRVVDVKCRWLRHDERE